MAGTVKSEQAEEGIAARDFFGGVPGDPALGAHETIVPVHRRGQTPASGAEVPALAILVVAVVAPGIRGAEGRILFAASATGMNGTDGYHDTDLRGMLGVSDCHVSTWFLLDSVMVCSFRTAATSWVSV